ncbi:MAG: hypothetical protein JO187_10760, partial [Acidobacteria bacterium]|nr:hypothetical protein [Acidobacteriota bacterium]
YRTEFEAPEFKDTRHVLLKFGAVDYFCEVFLNGISIGTHEGGYTPFSFDVTSTVRPGPNKLLVRVIDPPMDEDENRALFPSMMYNEIPHGKQNWYVQNSGIWQGVRLEFCPSLYIDQIHVTPRLSGYFEVEARLAGIGMTAGAGELPHSTKLAIRIYDSSGRSVFENTQPVGAAQILNVQGSITNPRLWSPDDPSLYYLDAWLEGAVHYRRRVRFGIRELKAEGGTLYVNGKPMFMVGALDQDFYPETVHSPASEEFVRDMMLKAKRLGINTLRCHLKVAHPVYLDIADEIGMLVWAELPSWSDCWFPCDHFSMMAAVRGEKMFDEILARDWNHPCIVVQTIMNESWGINLKDASQRQWLRDNFNRMKQRLAPLGRLVVDNSPCEGNFHIKTDIEDFHQYYSMPDQHELWDKWLAELAARPQWTFSPHGDAERTGNEPLLVSEFGNWGLPNLPSGELPWWFDVSFGGREVTRPGGVLERFREYGFGDIFGGYNELADHTQWHQFVSLKHEIESIRSYESIKGYVITGMTDVHWEANGLLDMWRTPKVYANELAGLQSPDVILCRLPRHSFYSGETIEVPTRISHYSDFELAGARVRWSTDSGLAGGFAIGPSIERGKVTELLPISLTIPQVDSPHIETLLVEARLRTGKRIADNRYDLFVLPQRSKANQLPIACQLTNGLSELLPQLGEGGYDLTTDVRSLGHRVLLTTSYTPEVTAHLQNGGRVLLLADSEDALPSDFLITVAKRAGTDLDGRWFSNFNWIRMSAEPFSAVAFTPILGFESSSVAPKYVLRNIPPGDFRDVLSGVTYAWLNKNSGLAVQLQAGPGKMLLTTFRFDQYGRDPYATHLLDALIRYVAGEQFRPRMEANIAAGVTAQL